LGSKEVQRLRDGLELVHTLMLKCYLKTKPMLIASLLKLPDNSCIFEEAEQDLKDANLPSELLILYERKEKHKEALDLLKEQAHIEGSPLNGLERTVEYLQELGEDHLTLIFEHAKWIIGWL
jgi:histidyl-tRNA synthetase